MPWIISGSSIPAGRHHVKSAASNDGAESPTSVIDFPLAVVDPKIRATWHDRGDKGHKHTHTHTQRVITRARGVRMRQALTFYVLIEVWHSAPISLSMLTSRVALQANLHLHPPILPIRHDNVCLLILGRLTHATEDIPIELHEKSQSAE